MSFFLVVNDKSIFYIIIMLNDNFEPEPRGENEPKFDPHNKTDRRILIIVLVVIAIFLAIVVGCFLIYYLLMKY